MFRYVLVTTVAIVGIMSYAGDPADAPQVSRAASSPVQGFSLADLVMAPAAATAAPATRSGAEALSEGEAIELALAAAREHRAQRKSAPSLRGLIDAAEASADETLISSEAETDYWFVTGTSVNLRAGPSTGNAVIGQVSLGQKAEVLSDPAAAWIEIRTAEGATGWIYGRYLDASRPG